MERHYSTGELARGIGVAPATVVDWIRTGKLEATRVGAHGRYRVPASAVERAIGLRLDNRPTPQPAAKG